MVAVCPLGDGPDERRCGCGRRTGSPKACRWRRSRGGCGCRRRRCTAGGSDGVAAASRLWPRRGPAARCRLDAVRLRRLADALDEGRAVHGFGADQRWTLARVSDLIARMFHIRYTLRGTANIMHRLGWWVQVPKHRGGRTRRGGGHHLAAGDVAGGKTVAAHCQAWLV